MMRYIVISSLVAAIAIVVIGTLFLALEDSTMVFKVCPLH